MTLRSFSKRFVLHLNADQPLLQRFLKLILCGLAFLGFSFLSLGSAKAQFSDVKSNPLYSPYIQTLSSTHLISGDIDLSGRPTGKFRPLDQLNRVELAKLATIVRLAEKRGKKDDWDELSSFQIDQEVFELLKDFLNCDEGACENIGDQPFSDVSEIKDPDCLNSKTISGSCKPWYTKFVYYAADKGFVKGHAPKPGETKRKYGINESILRIHAIKMMVVDNGAIEPEKDDRYDDLDDRANDNKAYAPTCLDGAENMILDLNGGNVPDAQKLLKYALLADRLNFFGADCEMFIEQNTVSLEKMAEWLNKPLTRQEAVRWFALSSLYKPIAPDPEKDDTVNSKDENKGTAADDKDYEIPEYEPTELSIDFLIAPEDLILPEEGEIDFESNLPDDPDTVACLNQKVKEHFAQVGAPTVLEMLYDYFKDNPQILVYIEQNYLKRPAGEDCGNLAYGEPVDPDDLFEITKFRLTKIFEVYKYSNLTFNKILEDSEDFAASLQGLVEDQDLPEPLKECPAGADMKYDVISVSPNPVYFAPGETQKTVQIKMENAGGYWGEKCHMQLNLGREDGLSWRDGKNQERDERGFEYSDRILGFEVLGNQTQVNVNTQTATLEVTLGANSNGRYMDQFEVNGSETSQKIYIYGQKESQGVAKRDFRTSVAEVRVRAHPFTWGKELKLIVAADTPIKVTGHAVMGEDVDLYKSYMWYPVEVEGVEGFMLATLLHPTELSYEGGTFEFIWSLIPFGWVNTERETIDPIKTVALHFTVGNSTVESVKNGFNNQSAHFVIGRDGRILQSVEDWNKAWHVNENFSTFTNDTSIGIEIVNWGRLGYDSNLAQCYHYWVEEICTDKCRKYTRFTPHVVNGFVDNLVDCGTRIDISQAA